MSGAGKVVCVTGASGYIASWLVKLLLDRGYTVKATVRSLNDPKKTEHLLALGGAKERLHLFEANLVEEESFDSAIDGCDGVFHTASPVYLSVTDPQAELIDPAVKGTLNVLRSCAKVSSVKRVVVTSSTASVISNNKPLKPDVAWYPLSKTLAEEAAWKFGKENGIDMVMINPGFVIGPCLQPTLNLTSEAILNLVKSVGPIAVVIQRWYQSAVAQGTVASAKKILWDSLLSKTMANTKERIDALEAQIHDMFKSDQDAPGILKQFSLRLDALEVNLEATDNTRYAESMEWEGKFQELQD
ncbi:hypothetical protein RJ639_027373 [Escallonia herrerae]|uniref:Dihydroflavonol 4-reductase n=1 Tax=Escallonia herrerae TaxID=1293975 RepID=A0AA88X384_9ASTE|nr:hypothetical protein RJ639_027373 [Escallonia herrerae]